MIEQFSYYYTQVGKMLGRLLSPPYCNACHVYLDQREALCDACLQDVQPLASKVLQVTPSFEMRVFCVGAYEEPLKRFILAKSRSEHVACYYIAQLIMKYSLVKHLDVDYIIPVPLHWKRYATRGYNQAEEIAAYLSKWMNVPILHAFKRIKATPFQSLFDKEGRLLNVKDAFVLSLTDQQKKDLKGKNILLVDDVMTTGATLSSLAKLLRPLHVEQLFGVVLARTH